MPVTLSQPVRQCNASAIPLGDDQASRRLRSAPVWPMARTVAFAPRPEDDHPWRTRESVAEGYSDARSQRIRDAPNTILDDEGRRNQPIERSGAFPVHFRCRIGNRPQRLPALPAWDTGPSPLPNRRFARWQRSRPAPPLCRYRSTSVDPFAMPAVADDRRRSPHRGDPRREKPSVPELPNPRALGSDARRSRHARRCVRKPASTHPVQSWCSLAP